MGSRWATRVQAACAREIIDEAAQQSFLSAEDPAGLSAIYGCALVTICRIAGVDPEEAFRRILNAEQETESEKETHRVGPSN